MKKKRVQVLFFPNGNTAVFENSEQVPELQTSWFLKFVEFLEENNVDVINSAFEFPDSENPGRWKKAKLIKIEDGYNWNMEVIEKLRQ